VRWRLADSRATPVVARHCCASLQLTFAPLPVGCWRIEPPANHPPPHTSSPPTTPPHPPVVMGAGCAAGPIARAGSSRRRRPSRRRPRAELRSLRRPPAAPPVHAEEKKDRIRRFLFWKRLLLKVPGRSNEDTLLQERGLPGLQAGSDVLKRGRDMIKRKLRHRNRGGGGGRGWGGGGGGGGVTTDGRRQTRRATLDCGATARGVCELQGMACSKKRHRWRGADLRRLRLEAAPLAGQNATTEGRAGKTRRCLEFSN